WGNVTRGISTVAPMVTSMLIVLGWTTFVAGDNVRRVCDSDEVVTPIGYSLALGAELEEAQPTRAHISLSLISSSALDSL
ncbi:hypothetical protein HAX54_021918, partial [Datura stramonium]|nr:hypothetical protein [Datura stramonium]